MKLNDYLKVNIKLLSFYKPVKTALSGNFVTSIIQKLCLDKAGVGCEKLLKPRVLDFVKMYQNINSQKNNSLSEHFSLHFVLMFEATEIEFFLQCTECGTFFLRSGCKTMKFNNRR